MMIGQALNKAENQIQRETNTMHTHRGEAFDAPQTRILQQWLLDNI